MHMAQIWPDGARTFTPSRTSFEKECQGWKLEMRLLAVPTSGDGSVDFFLHILQIRGFLLGTIGNAKARLDTVEAVTDGASWESCSSSDGWDAMPGMNACRSTPAGTGCYTLLSA